MVRYTTSAKRVYLRGPSDSRKRKPRDRDRLIPRFFPPPAHSPCTALRSSCRQSPPRARRCPRRRWRRGARCGCAGSRRRCRRTGRRGRDSWRWGQSGLGLDRLNVFYQVPVAQPEPVPLSGEAEGAVAGEAAVAGPDWSTENENIATNLFYTYYMASFFTSPPARPKARTRWCRCPRW